jgi:hypothetical protein
MKEVQLQIVRKNSKSYLITLTRNSVPVNIVGWTLCFTVKKLLTDTDVQAKISKDVTIANTIDAQNGICRLILTPTETNILADNYYYELLFKNGSDYREVYMRGLLNIIPSLRQA